MSRRVLILLCLLLLLTPVSVNAQGGIPFQPPPDDPYQYALGQIKDAEHASTSRLNLSGLGLRRLPPEIGVLTDLEHLVLQNNQLTGLPDSIGQLGNLKTLNVSNNRLAELPDALWRLTELESLFLRNNRLTHLPGDIRKLKNLDMLGLSGNQLTHLPLAIGDMELNPLFSTLTYNPLEFPPPEVVAHGNEAILDFLRDPQPYPPHEVSVGVVVITLLTPLLWGLSLVGLLGYARRWHP